MLVGLDHTCHTSVSVAQLTHSWSNPTNTPVIFYILYRSEKSTDTHTDT